MSTTTQPLEYGGYFVYVDETGVYPPEAELLEVEELYDGRDQSYTVHRFTLEPCTYVNGVLSDNPYHPSNPVWFVVHDGLNVLASYIGTSTTDLIKLFTSNDPIERAHAWRAVGEYHGFENLDDYPLQLSRAEAEERYREELSK